MHDASSLMEMHTSHGGKLSYQEIAELTGATYESVRSKIRRIRRKQNHTPLSTKQSTVLSDTSLKVTTRDDWDIWSKALNNLPNEVRYAHITDIHVGDHDQRAIDLAAQIISDYKPHVMPHGNDGIDFGTISRFETAIDQLLEDALLDLEMPYAEAMKPLNQAAADAWKPHLIGNHDKRVINFMQQKAPQFRGTVIKHYSDMIRRNQGLWLGFDFESFKIGCLNVIHGIGTGVNAARLNMETVTAYQEDVVGGHNHQFTELIRVGPRRTSISMTSGCLCKLKPHYASFQQKWQQGIILITIDKADDKSYFEKIIFNDYTASWNGRVYRA